MDQENDYFCENVSIFSITVFRYMTFCFFFQVITRESLLAAQVNINNKCLFRFLNFVILHY